MEPNHFDFSNLFADFEIQSLHCKSQTHPFSISFGIADNGSIVAVGRLVRHRCRLYGNLYLQFRALSCFIIFLKLPATQDDKVTVLESEKRAWENSPEVQAMREALNPWRNHDAQERKSS
ncbi:hypothetical protein V6N13_107563 [Hibiscus sabdariffa]